MEPQAFEGIAQLGFAIGIATWLVYWLTTSLKKSVEALAESMASLHLHVSELYRLLLQHDAQIRGVNPTAGDDADDAHRKAAEIYRQACGRLDSLHDAVQNWLGHRK